MRALRDKEILALYGPMAKSFGETFKIPPALILAVIKQETRGDVSAIGTTPDFGLMQITQPALDQYNKGTNSSLNMADVYFDYMVNIMVGTWYLHWCADFLETTDWRKVAQAYNAGVGNVQKGLPLGSDYAANVWKYYMEFQTIMV